MTALREPRSASHVSALRSLILAHRHIAVLICMAALALKLIVPAGYMVASQNGRVTITLCSGVAPAAMPAMHGDMADHEKPGDHGQTEMPCAFTALSAHALGGIDPIVLLAAIAFVMAAALRPVRTPVRAGTPYLRPPQRGPPATA
ncbi:DUF2946 family protein [Sphingomonas arantia]|uniref:DUF2946 family protein n=1 Tax=Sphingomonas arantia TaxID=1460676 RepID=A0ABW4TVL5_9SPHN